VTVQRAYAADVPGERLGRHADLWLTQWPHLATPSGPVFAGAVL
jgi:hypothetical protein